MLYIYRIKGGYTLNIKVLENSENDFFKGPTTTNFLSKKFLYSKAPIPFSPSTKKINKL